MAIFLRGNVWWFEWRTRRERVVKSTGFRRDQRAKAQAVFDTFRLSKRTKPKRSVVEGLLDAIYDSPAAGEHGTPLSSVWAIYQDWMKGKSRVVSPKTISERKGLVERFVEWASARGCSLVSDVDVFVARAYVAHMRSNGRSNKTLRNSADSLGGIWRAIGQLVPGTHNPWSAARPDNDGSGVRREAFTVDEERRVLEAARTIGHDWWLASVISLCTGQRYGDVARLDWSAIDMRRRTVSFRPSKTKRHDIRLLIPMSRRLYDVLSAIPADRRSGFVLPEHGMKYPFPMEPAFVDVLKAAGLDDGRFTFHSFRHTFRTRLGDAGVPDAVAMRFGWTNLAMSKHYDHAEHLAEMRDAVDRLD